MTVIATRPAVTASATKMFDHGSSTGPITILVTNVGANPCDLGGPGVTVGAGYPLAANASVTLTLKDDDDELFAISTVGTTLAILSNQ